MCVLTSAVLIIVFKCFFCILVKILKRKKNQKTNKHELDKEICENNNFYNVTPSEDTKSLEFNQYRKFDKATFIVYADLIWLIE